LQFSALGDIRKVTMQREILADMLLSADGIVKRSPEKTAHYSGKEGNQKGET